ncbi:hypothetical protein PVK06_026470 [Gossypium arboreum]|uniref:DNA-directed RNA polymerase RpoA/D/Rpb3-type domain-containing protein n=1 Tax=Gossypium arboreum TaxID=29729 RepID=A0ABR0NXU3_GOSAR|nr:hypothetical protein PVK06_026470 [Gossypium arboreum]
MIIRYDDNAAVVIDQEGNPKGTRIFDNEDLILGYVLGEFYQRGIESTKVKNGRSSARKSARRIPKGVIHVQASFNNTIVTVTDVRGRVISWSSASTCGFKGTRRGTPFAAQTAAGNAIRAVVDQEKVKVSTSTRTRQWKCVESRTDSKRLYYGRFILSPLMKGQADTIGIAMRRALLGELEGTCITRAKSEKIPHEYSTIVGIQELVHEILMNLKKIVLRGNLYRTRNAFICAKGPEYVTAQDIILPPSVEIVDNTQHVANLTEPIDLCIGLQIERNRGYSIKNAKELSRRKLSHQSIISLLLTISLHQEAFALKTFHFILF